MIRESNNQEHTDIEKATNEINNNEIKIENNNNYDLINIYIIINYDLIFTLILFAIYITNIFFNFYVGAIGNTCVNQKSGELNLLSYLYVCAILRCANAMMYYIIYSRTILCDCYDKLKMQWIIPSFILLILNQIWTIVGTFLFFENILFYKNNCSKQIFYYVMTDLLLRIIFLCVILFNIINYFLRFYNY